MVNSSLLNRKQWQRYVHRISHILYLGNQLIKGGLNKVKKPFTSVLSYYMQLYSYLVYVRFHHLSKGNAISNSHVR